METKLLKVVFVVLFFSAAAKASIVNVSISPITPTFTDPITILIDGMEGSGGVQITNTDFIINGNSISLDIYINRGIVQVVTPWSHSELIGTLPADTYNLTVRRFLPPYYPPDIIVSSYSISFEVTPEPSILAIFGVALPIFRIFSRKKI
jgi:hypothetical protein